MRRIRIWRLHVPRCAARWDRQRKRRDIARKRPWKRTASARSRREIPFICSMSGVQGTVLKPEDKDGMVYVQAGILKVNVPINELRIEQPKKKQQPKTRKAYRTAGASPEVRRSAQKASWMSAA